MNMTLEAMLYEQLKVKSEEQLRMAFALWQASLTSATSHETTLTRNLLLPQTPHQERPT